ncbi:CYTH domain-containing protein [Chachezhania sediminis]|uniref:CYTH domain-containing protein n=1 Tax=Chachezhania sediminis TaxID=2599291 RepID=UPI00131BCF2D|nr:CYTH domain-containing protein [Chachezhania sediminis]
MADATEIERKFLVSRRPSLDGVRRAEVRQGYLTHPDDSVELRVRQINDRYFLTLKSGEGLTRGEREMPISRAQFDTLWPATEGRRVEKERWTGDLEAGRVFELDIFTGTLAPLMLVEVEFDTEEAANGFQPPDWFGPDVTRDKRFKNKALAQAVNSFLQD